MPAKPRKQPSAAPGWTAAKPVEAAPGAVAMFLERYAPVLFLVLVLIASARIVATYGIFNHTFDEPAHIACGMEWLDKGVYRWEPQHPPLARVAAALLPYLAGVRSQNTPNVDEYSFSREGLAILYHDHRYDRVLMLARLGILPFFWIACVVVYWWGRRYYGAAAAVAAVFLFSFLPPVLAHASLATTDMAFTAFLGAAFLTGTIWLEEPNLKTGAAFGAATGLAIVSKFSTLAFFPAGILALACYLFAARFDSKRIMQAVRPRAASFGLAVGVACALVWAVYRFSFGAPGGHGIPMPAPELFQGIRDVAEHNQHGHPGYLMGAYSRFGFWYFYPVVLAVKTPIAFLLLLCAGLWLAVRKRAFGPKGWIPPAIAAGMLLIAAFSRINIGVRHVLPVYMFFSMIAGAALLRLIQDAGARKWVPAVLLALVAWFAASSLLSHPDYLPYFNEFAGSEPEKIVVDSDLDWGQDVKRLAARLRQAGAREVTFANQMLPDFRSEFGLPPMVERMDVTTRIPAGMP